jgi:hypothetical protein
LPPIGCQVDFVLVVDDTEPGVAVEEGLVLVLADGAEAVADAGAIGRRNLRVPTPDVPGELVVVDRPGEFAFLLALPEESPASAPLVVVEEVWVEGSLTVWVRVPKAFNEGFGFGFDLPPEGFPVGFFFGLHGFVPLVVINGPLPVC